MSLRDASASRLAVLLFTDLVGSTQLQSKLGAQEYVRLLGRHDELFRRLLGECQGAEVLADRGDGYFAAFVRVSDAVKFALKFQNAMRREPWGGDCLRSRLGIHMGEVSEIHSDSPHGVKIVGLAADMASRVMELAAGGQILMTRGAFDESRQFVREFKSDHNGAIPLRWVAHGAYLFKGIDSPVEIFEVGVEGESPLSPPGGSIKARRSVSAEEEQTLGWRPAVGLAIPDRSGWMLEKKLGEGMFGEVWLARHEKLKQYRVFKFCFDLERLRSFKREITFFRLLRDALGERPDIARLHDVQLDRPPFFLESDYAPEGSLAEWVKSRGSLNEIPLSTRLEIVARVCDAVAAAHSIGILHKDIKPTNILMREDRNRTPVPQLSDFGIGWLADRSQLAARNITEIGLTFMDEREATRSGTRLYAPPETLIGRPFTTQGDIYALGVLLFQMVVGDLDRPVAAGWERDVADEFLREDIAACVDGEPERRVRSAAEIASRLRELEKRKQTRERERSLARRYHQARMAIALIGVFALIIAVGAFLHFQQQRLRTTAREAQWEHAAGGLEQGMALFASGRGEEARRAFINAREALQRLGVSSLPAEVGLYRSYREQRVPINTIHAQSEGLMATAWLPDGCCACSAGENGAVKLWDARTGAELKQYGKFNGYAMALAVSADGKLLLAGGRDDKDGVVCLWDVQTGALLHSWTEPRTEIRGVALSPDGRIAVAATTGTQGCVRAWNVASGAELRRFNATPESFYAVAFSRDGSRLLATTYACEIWIWDVKSGAVVQELKGHRSYVVSAAFSPDGEEVISGSFDKRVKLWNVQTGSLVRTMTGHDEGVRCVCFVGSTGEKALSCDAAGALILWDLQTGEVLRKFAGHIDEIRSIAVTADGRRAISASADQTLRVWDLNPNGIQPTTSASSIVTSQTLSPDGKLLISGDASGEVLVTDLATFRPIARLDTGSRPVVTATLLNDGSRLLVTDDTGAATFWNLPSFRKSNSYPPRQLPGDSEETPHENIPGMQPQIHLFDRNWCYTSIAASAERAISSGADHTSLDIWSTRSGKTIARLGPMDHPVTCVAISNDGAFALCGDRRGTICYWEIDSGRLLFQQSSDLAHPGQIDCLTFSHDGKRALSGGHDKVLRLWDLENHKLIRQFQGHTLVVSGADFAMNGRMLFSIGRDQSLRLWDIESGREMDLGAHFLQPAFAMVIAPSGDCAVCGAGTLISAWDMHWPVEYLEFQSRLEGIRIDRGDDRRQAAALATLGQWYAFLGISDWAAQLLERARAAGANVSSLTLARCYWELDRRSDATREFERALANHEDRADYLRLCAQAAARPAPATRPAVSAAAQALARGIRR